MSVSAVVLQVPEAEALVGALRERLDPSARLGVPAHVTLLHPFMAPERIEAGIAARLAALAAAALPFFLAQATLAWQLLAR